VKAQPNATAIDSQIYRDVFSASAMRSVWSDQARIQAYLNIERALPYLARLGVISGEAVHEIGSDCNVGEMDWDKMTSQMEHIGYPVLPVVEQLRALRKNGLGQWCHWCATTQDITDTATVLKIRSAKAHVVLRDPYRSRRAAISVSLSGRCFAAFVTVLHYLRVRCS
jgi:3-carboxy-cis,cis-muconate cycloisomerase